MSCTACEARVMKMADGGFRPAFNAQLAVDTATLIITGGRFAADDPHSAPTTSKWSLSIRRSRIFDPLRKCPTDWRTFARTLLRIWVSRRSRVPKPTGRPAPV